MILPPQEHIVIVGSLDNALVWFLSVNSLICYQYFLKRIAVVSLTDQRLM